MIARSSCTPWTICCLGLAIIASADIGRALDRSHVDYLALVKDYAEAMIEKGRDSYGTEHTPLFASTLDRSTMQIGEFPSIIGVRKGDRSLGGANPQEEFGLYDILYRLSELTGERRYAEAADQALDYFFSHCQSESTGLMAWGEHLFWSFTTEGPGREDGIHEVCGEWPFWDQCYRLAPEACWRFALGQWDHQVGDKQTGDFSRHARWARHGPGRGTDFPRYAGQMIASWADALWRAENRSRARRDDLLTAIETLVGRMETNMKASKAGYLLAGTDKTHSQIAWPVSNLELARCLWKAAPHVNDELAQRMKRLALQQDRHFHQMPHRIMDGGGFVATIDSRSGEPRSRSMNRPYTAVWATGYGHGIHAGAANKLYERYLQLRGSHPDLAQQHRKLIVAAARQYLVAQPDRQELLKPTAFAEVIGLMLSAFGLTDDSAFLKRADAFGRMGVELFLGDELALSMATNQHGHYETITGGPDFMHALLRLHETLN